MKYTTLGKTGISASALGYGAGHIGSNSMDEESVLYLLHKLYDNGINFIDTARGYGSSEERIGKFIESIPRDKVVLCTKVGYGVDGVEDWTYDCIIKGVERALSMMKTSYIDIVLLHTCPHHVLSRFDVVRALIDMKNKGYIRAIGYSGDNEDLEYALNIHEFDCFEGSYNIFDQKKNMWLIEKLHQENRGFIAKRPVANAPWRFEEHPYGNYCEEYWIRMQKLNYEFQTQDPLETALRFTAYTTGVSTSIIGSTNINHINQNIAFFMKGPLDNEYYHYLKRKYFEEGMQWRSEV